MTPATTGGGKKKHPPPQNPLAFEQVAVHRLDESSGREMERGGEWSFLMLPAEESHGCPSLPMRVVLAADGRKERLSFCEPPLRPGRLDRDEPGQGSEGEEGPIP